MTATQTPRLTPQDQQDDEIDLFELWDQLIAEKLTIILSAVIVVVLAAGYAFLVTPTFKASSFLMPPLIEDVASINQLGLLVKSENLLKPEDIFNLFKTNLTSKETLKIIFDKYGETALYDASYEALSKQEQRKRYNLKFAIFINALSLSFFDKKDPLQGF